MTGVDAAGGTVRATVEVPLPPAEAFRLFTAEIGAWYVVDEHTVTDHRRTVDVRIEPFPGGRFLEVHDAASGDGHEMGRITLWEPPRRFRFTDARDTHTEVRFDPVAGGTAVTIEQGGLDRLPPDEADHVRRFGWHLLLGWFAAAVPVSLRDPTTPPEEDDTMPAIDTDVTIQGLTPYLYYEDAGAALDWLARVFGFDETVRYVDDDGVVHESEMQVGAATVQLCGRRPGPDEGTGLLLIVHVDDVDAMQARVMAAGVEAAPPEQQPYGPRTFEVTDPWGYRWNFWQHVQDYVQEPGGLREVRPAVADS